MRAFSQPESNLLWAPTMSSSSARFLRKKACIPIAFALQSPNCSPAQRKELAAAVDEQADLPPRDGCKGELSFPGVAFLCGFCGLFREFPPSPLFTVDPFLPHPLAHFSFIEQLLEIVHATRALDYTREWFRDKVSLAEMQLHPLARSPWTEKLGAVLLRLSEPVR